MQRKDKVLEGSKGMSVTHKTRLTRQPQENVAVGKVVHHLGTFGLQVRIRAARNARLGQSAAGAGHHSRGDKHDDLAEAELWMHGVFCERDVEYSDGESWQREG